MKTAAYLRSFIFLSLVGFSMAEEVNLPPPYVPQQQVSGTIRIWGHGSLGKTQDFIETLAKTWEAGFRKYQPGVEFKNELCGTAAAIGALYTGQGDLALMGREIWDPEVVAFQEVLGYPATGVDVVTGSFNVRNRGYALVLFVHKDNPLSRLTLKQVDAIYSANHRRGGSPVRTWGDLGLTGEWQSRPVHPYGFAIARGFCDFIQDKVFLGSHKWNPDVREFADLPGSKGGATDGGQLMLDAMANDPAGIAFSGLVYNHPNVKPIAIAEQDGGPYVEPTRENVMNHSYPLTRIITMYLNKPPGQPTDPKLKEFLRYVLSREAQDAILREGQGYLPILAPFAEKELKKLD
ncbi:MAG: hypothetical protein PHQ04_09140 [Opitutaceae bacterium]|nr:hypothetical protein [Opitutaceae bacterium]